MSQNNTELTTVDEEITDLPETPGLDNPENKKLNVVGPDHHTVQEVGDSAMEKEITQGGKAAKFFSENIYEHDNRWSREWLQNHEAACVRAGKYLIRTSDEYPKGWLTLTIWVDEETGDIVVDYDENEAILADYDGEVKDLRKIEVPRPIDDVLEAARSLGYDPTIVWDVYLDERQIVTKDNGIGMTPTEFKDDFNNPFGSGSDKDGETGGFFGIGSESVAIVTGAEGGVRVQTRSRQATEDGEVRKGFTGYGQIGVANFLPELPPEGFFGTKFEIPVKEDFNLNKLQGWVEKFSEKLRVPLLYREHDAGTTPVEEEYEATSFVDDYDDPPVVIQRPGEFSIVAGPDVVDTSYRSDDEDTFLVSMPIDRNTDVNIRTFWNVVIQIHDEQGKIIAGPNRGQYLENLDFPHEDDIALPEPTGDRDRLARDENSKKFFNYVEDVVKEKELAEVGEIAERMKEAPHPTEAIRNAKSDWTLFRKMIDHHGKYHATNQLYKFKETLDKYPEVFPDYSEKETRQIFGLFKELEHCPNGPKVSTKKSRRREITLGKLLAKHDRDQVYMAASTGGRFKERFQVVENTYDSPEVVIVPSASKYEKWSELFGFKVLKEVPLMQPTEDEDHDYDVPNYIHQDTIDRKRKKKKKKADKVEKRTLKIRTNGDNSSIDLRISIDKAQDMLEQGNSFGKHKHGKLVVFPRSSDENISDHYDFADYAPITSVTKEEYEQLEEYDNVMTYKDFTEWSKSALIATEDGAMTPQELIEDDRMVILAYRQFSNNNIVKLLSNEHEELRNLYAKDIRDQFTWADYLDDYDGGIGYGNSPDVVPDEDKAETLFAVAGPIVLRRAEWAFGQQVITDREMMGLKLTRDRFGHRNPCQWNDLSETTAKYRLMADTPNWNNGSEVYDLIPKDRDKYLTQLFLGFHDQGIDPTDRTPNELRQLID